MVEYLKFWLMKELTGLIILFSVLIALLFLFVLCLILDYFSSKRKKK
jgi:hypothetical protein